MAGPEEKQLAHAEEIRQRRRGGNEKPLTRADVIAIVAAELAKVQIVGSGNIVVSGKLPTLSIGINPQTVSISATGTMDCDADPPSVTLNGTATVS